MISALFDLPGPQFLLLYVVGLAVALALGGPFRKLCRWIHPDTGLGSPAQSSPYELAFLAGGAPRAIEAALASLAHRGVLKPEPDGQGFGVVDGDLPADAHELEAELHGLVRKGKGDATLLKRRSLAAIKKIEARLRKRGYVHVPAAPETRCLRWAAGVPLLALMLMGLAKVAVGLSRGRPIGFLLILLAVSAVLLVVRASMLPARTERGDRHLVDMRRRNAALETTAARRGSQLAQADMMLAVALFGLPALAGSELAWMKPMLYPAPAGGNGGGDSSSSSSSCSSGSSSCGSSCGGGGGCGGCGS